MEQVILDAGKERRQLVIQPKGKRQTKQGVQFIHRAIGSHARVIFGHPACKFL
jgi:hypothetical protein